MRDLLHHCLFIESLEIRALRIVTQFATQSRGKDHAGLNRFGVIFHRTLAHILFARAVARLARDPIFHLDLLGRDGFREVVSGRVALQTFPAFLRIGYAEFFRSLQSRWCPERGECVGMWAGLPLGELIAGGVLLVTDST